MLACWMSPLAAPAVDDRFVGVLVLGSQARVGCRLPSAWTKTQIQPTWPVPRGTTRWNPASAMAANAGAVWQCTRLHVAQQVSDAIHQACCCGHVRSMNSFCVVRG